MARSTIDEDISRLEIELAALRSKISHQEALREIEEGGAGSKFRTSFTGATALYDRERTLESRLETLYNYKARI